MSSNMDFYLYVRLTDNQLYMLGLLWTRDGSEMDLQYKILVIYTSTCVVTVVIVHLECIYLAARLIEMHDYCVWNDRLEKKFTLVVQASNYSICKFHDYIIEIIT